MELPRAKRRYLRQGRNPGAIHGHKTRMVARIVAGRIRTAKIEKLELGERQIFDLGCFTRQPMAITPGQGTVEAKIVMNDRNAICGKLNIELRAVAAKRDGMAESRQRVLRPKPRPAPMRDVPNRHDRHASRQKGYMPIRA